jgi:predicted RNA methylase
MAVSTMAEMRTERELATIAGAFISPDSLTVGEQDLLQGGRCPDPATVEACRALMAFGLDPLGESFLSIRSPEKRRDAGAVYTPEVIIKAMMDWASNEGVPTRVVDPGSGSGRFIAAAAKAFPLARLVACDVDPLAMLLLRAKATVQGFADRLDAQLIDYRELTLPQQRGKTLFIGNPPYVRHHKLSATAKDWFVETAKRFGYRASKLSGLHAHFFLRTRELARDGDYGAFVTSAEWMDVNYGSVIREMLGDGLGGAALHLFAPKGMPFADTMTTGVITCFKVGHRPDDFVVRELADLGDLDDLTLGRPVPWKEVRTESRWSKILRESPPPREGLVELGSLFRVHRGTVTGNNRLFIAGAFPGALPERFLLPAVTKARELFDAGSCLRTIAKLRRVISIPPNLADLSREERQQIDGFLKWARALGAHDSYTARSRGAWWTVKMREPAPILCTYMARRRPAFVRNSKGARHINIAHGLYPRVNMSAADLDAYAGYLSAHVSIADGRTYAGGLTKFEPKEIERILVPCLKDIRGDCPTPRVDSRRAGKGCRNCESGLQV